jgi:hypothetical protein
MRIVKKVNNSEKIRSLEEYEEISQRIQGYKNKKSQKEEHKTYNEALREFLPEWQMPYVNSLEFVDLCYAFDKLMNEWNQENQHKLSLKKHAFEFYCKQQIKEKLNND